MGAAKKLTARVGGFDHKGLRIDVGKLCTVSSRVNDVFHPELLFKALRSYALIGNLQIQMVTRPNLLAHGETETSHGDTKFVQ